MPGEHKSPMILSAVSGILFFAPVLTILTPGPNIVYVLSRSALLGGGARLRATKGICTGLLARTIAVFFGVAAIFQTTALAFITLGITRSRATADGLRRDMVALVSGLAYAIGTRAVVLGKPAR